MPTEVPSPQPSVDRLSVTFAPEERCVFVDSSTCDSVFSPGSPPIFQEVSPSMEKVRFSRETTVTVEVSPSMEKGRFSRETTVTVAVSPSMEKVRFSRETTVTVAVSPSMEKVRFSRETTVTAAVSPSMENVRFSRETTVTVAVSPSMENVRFSRETTVTVEVSPSMENVRFSRETTVKDGEDDEDYSASVNAIMQRRASTRRPSKRRGRRPSSPFSPDADSGQSLGRRRSSVFTLSSGDTAISMDEGMTQEQIYENLRLHKEVLSSVKQQPWGMRKKLRLVHQAKAFVKKHEGELQERLAQNKTTRDILARFNLLIIKRGQYLKRELANFVTLLIPWELRIKEIESHFGSVVASYFTFLRWLFWVNLVICVLLVAFVAIPEVSHTMLRRNVMMLTADKNRDGMRKRMTPEEETKSTNLITLWNFEGVLKYSPIFYGYYTNKDDNKKGYRLPFAYFMTGLAVYVYSFVATLSKMAQNSRMSKLSEKDDECIFTWKLFTRWDYMIGNAETAHNRTASIILGFKEALLEEAEKRRNARSSWRVISLRVLVNLTVLLLLVASAYAVVMVVNRSTEPGNTWWSQNETTIVISIISFLFPLIFEVIGLLEYYHPRKQLRIQLASCPPMFATPSDVSHRSWETETSATFFDLLPPDTRAMFPCLQTQGKHRQESLAVCVYLAIITVQLQKLRENTTISPFIAPTASLLTMIPTTSHYYQPDQLSSDVSPLTDSPFDEIVTTVCYNVSVKCNTLLTASPMDAITSAMVAMLIASITSKPPSSNVEYVTPSYKDPEPETFPSDTTELEDYTPSNLYETTTSQLFWTSNSPTTDGEVNGSSSFIFPNDTWSESNIDYFTGTENSSLLWVETRNDSLNNETMFIEQDGYVDSKSSKTRWPLGFFEVLEGVYSHISYATSKLVNPENAVDELDFDQVNKFSTSPIDEVGFPDKMNTSVQESDVSFSTTSVYSTLLDSTVSPSLKNVLEGLGNVTLNDTMVRQLTTLLSSMNPEEPDDDMTCYVTECLNETSTTGSASPSTPFSGTRGSTSPSALNTTRYATNLSFEVSSIYSYRSGLLEMEIRKNLSRLCWETMFGQELVKLTIMDLVLTIVATLFVDFFRALFVRVMNNLWCWDLEKQFPQYGDFKIAENILHLVNNQGMVWMGMFFSPGLPLINTIKLVIMMYLRSWAVLTCNVPHEVVFRASRSNNFYLALLLTMLFLCVLPVGYAIVWVEPSWHCGPFSDHNRIYHLFTGSLQKALPKSLHFPLDYIASPSIVIPLLVLLVLIIYYLASLTGALREANNDLKYIRKRQEIHRSILLGYHYYFKEQGQMPLPPFLVLTQENGPELNTSVVSGSVAMIQLRRERSEERRRVMQLVGQRRRGGSGGDSADTPFSRWRKIIPVLPPGKTPFTDRDGEIGADKDDVTTVANGNLKNEVSKNELIEKLMKRALRKSSATSDDESAPVADEEATDIELHDSLPDDVSSVTKASSNKDRNVSQKNKSTDKPKDLSQGKDPEKTNRRSQLPKQRRRHNGSRPKSPPPNYDNKDREDSLTSCWSDNIPVIKISKTDSAECVAQQRAEPQQPSRTNGSSSTTDTTVAIEPVHLPGRELARSDERLDQDGKYRDKILGKMVKHLQRKKDDDKEEDARESGGPIILEMASKTLTHERDRNIGDNIITEQEITATHSK
uniref:TMC domain-containing protein n=1 Tax=Timema bartmani TaxID=61472 RepID=A0A7R9ESZ2_9NEOP|nr:unnamed protein product [Timema bartmani]